MKMLCLLCNKRPSFNYEGKKRRIYCFEHKLDNMIDVADKKLFLKRKNNSINTIDDKINKRCKLELIVTNQTHV